MPCSPHRSVPKLSRRFLLLAICAAMPCGFTSPAPGEEPSQQVVWRMVVLPDTQNYVSRGQEELDIFNFTTQWIAENKDQEKIGLVINEGDIVNSAGNDLQWERAKAAISKLDGHVPYVITTGNHDHGDSNSEHRGTKFNDYFAATDNPLNDPAKGGILRATHEPGRLENAIYEFTAPDGRKLLITALEWSPRDEPVAWASRIAGAAEYGDHTGILTTHAYMYYDDTRYDVAGSNNSQSWSPYNYPTAKDPGGVNDGEDLWQKLIRANSIYRIVVNGHVLGDQVARLTSLNDAGEKVYQMLYNAQNDPHGGDGWIRVFDFLDDGQTVHVRTISPWLAAQGKPAERTGDDYDFMIELSKAGRGR